MRSFADRYALITTAILLAAMPLFAADADTKFHNAPASARATKNPYQGDDAAAQAGGPLNADASVWAAAEPSGPYWISEAPSVLSGVEAFPMLSMLNPSVASASAVAKTLDPISTTGRGPKRSDKFPQTMLPNAMARKPKVMALDMPVMDHPVSREMGRRKTGSENMAPIATQPRRPPAATITQR